MTTETGTIPDDASEIRIKETGQTWWRVYGGRFDGLWTDDDSPTVPAGRGLRPTEFLPTLGTVEIVERWEA